MLSSYYSHGPCLVSGVCEADGTVRLTGGPNDFEGRVEVCLDGAWRRWCLPRGVIDDEATVICRQLGHNDNLEFPGGWRTFIWSKSVHICLQVQECLTLDSMVVEMALNSSIM